MAVMGQTTAEWAIADLGVLTAGGVSVGIYPSLPPRDVASILKDCNATIALVGSPAELRAIEQARRDAPSLRTVVGWGDAEKSTA